MSVRLRRLARRSAVLACGLAALCGAAAASAGTVAPRPEQVRALVQGDPDEPLALVRLLRGKAPADFERYMRALETDVRARGAERVYGGRVAPALSGGALDYDTLVIDVFPSRRACVDSLRALDPLVTSLGLDDAFVLVLRPWGSAFRLGAEALAALLGAFPREIGEPPPFASAESDPALAGGREIAPDAAAAAAFMQADQGAPFAMLNLNQFRAQAVSGAGVSGERAYSRYGRSALWHVLRRGGRLLFAGEPIGVAVGAAGSPLDRSWDQLVLVYYPSRRHLRDMLADADYRAALPDRVAGLERAALLPSEPWPAFAPRPR